MYGDMVPWGSGPSDDKAISRSALRILLLSAGLTPVAGRPELSACRSWVVILSSAGVVSFSRVNCECEMVSVVEWDSGHPRNGCRDPDAYARRGLRA
ncbi:hypothetical protein CMUS01_13653 [Colletotrichum musicola]|uniref:Uncharacterized protein n=1 Tax=Colletotrichum musicola TaxID=2175873 RepID=A0A8H6JAL8_9PEZI|nr:hypothetical protein CMUS01_13653 [Colletotrichum musicola]